MCGSNLKDKIKRTVASKNNIAMWWLGQAGFVVKTDGGKVIYIDPYLSEAVERLCGFKRLSLSPIKAEEVEADFLICTHEHPDHLDPDALPIIAENTNAKFIGPLSCIMKFKELGISPERLIKLEEGQTITEDGFSVTGVYADHGEQSPDALGILIDFGRVTVYHCGDTAYRPERMGCVKGKQPEVLISPINGQFGNLDEEEAVLLAKYVEARLVIPSHFWMFAEHNGNPGRFLEIAGREGIPVRLLSPGEKFTIVTR